MDGLDYWRFCEELTVVQAALLIVGKDPSDIAHYLDGWKPEERPQGYNAVLSALQHSIISERLKAATTSLNLSYEHPDSQHPINSIDWHATLVRVEALKVWLASRGVQSGFFFPEGPVTAEYLDTENPNFAPKLAAAVQAWKAVRAERMSKPSARTVKQDLTRWLNLHAAEYGLTNDDEGEPNKQAIEDVSKVANWDTKGGAPKTPGN
jgi:hypothetical protein